uniref:Translation initiation factor 5A C-terminal domain-containing protein n=1 Tax=Quercus lobata TaxID=97700 RepID=A0A7N2LAM1_QUELO
MKHGRGTRGAAPVSDTAGRGDAQGMPLPARPAASRHVVPRGFHVLFVDSHRREPTRLQHGPIHPKSGRLRPESVVSAVSAEIKKKKIKDGFGDGKDLVVSVMSAMGEEQICGLKDIGPK